MKKETFERLKAQWSPICLDSHKRPGIQITRWTPSALDCLKINANCTQCKITKHLHRHWYLPDDSAKKCWMPLTVQMLIDKKTKNYTLEATPV